MSENHDNDPSIPFIIQDLDTLKVIADPLHLQILEILTQEVLTVKQVAEKLGLSPSKLYYHINLMEKHGLIRVVETRMVANIVEKLYRASSSRVDIDPGLLSFSTETGQETLQSVAFSTIDATRADLHRSLEARSFNLEHGDKKQPRSAVITRMLSHLPEERAREYHVRLQQLIEEFQDADQQDPGLQPYALSIIYYPSFYFRTEEDSSELTNQP